MEQSGIRRENARAAMASGIMLAMLAACAGQKPPPPSFAGFIQSQTAPDEPWSGFPGVVARRLSADEFTGRRALYLELPLGWRWSGFINDAFSREWYILDGRLQAGAGSLTAGDFLYLPPGSRPPELTAVVAARALLFVDPASPASGLTQPFVTSAGSLPWRPGTLARDAGVPLDLSVKDLKLDPGSGARTWLVRIGPGVRVPWESHSVAEEGYLLEGDYRLVECLPEGRREGTYLPGGYFRRPAGWIHSGPDSGTEGGAVWLIRSPGALDVRFHEGCGSP